MNKGTTVYLEWYDFRQQTEHVCRGEIVDNSIWADTQWRDYINVRFQPPGMSAAICRHFPADKLSEDVANVPHDDCYLVCGKKTRAFEHDYTVSATPKTTPSDTWQQVQQFKQEQEDDHAEGYGHKVNDDRLGNDPVNAEHDKPADERA